MMRKLGYFIRNSVGSVAVETAIFTPIFLALMLGITDLGAGMFVRMQVNAAAQAGATYAVLNSSTPVCTTLTSTCLDGIQQAMNDASGNSSFCTGTVCTASIGVCADGSPHQCIIVTANYPYTPLLPDAVYTWALAQNYSSVITLRIQ
jgi:Flp pilus assembly protein TadG